MHYGLSRRCVRRRLVCSTSGPPVGQNPVFRCPLISEEKLDAKRASWTSVFLRWVRFLAVHDSDLDAIAYEEVIMHPSVGLFLHSIDATDRKRNLVLVRAAVGINAAHQCSNDGVQLANTGGANFDFVDVNLECNHRRMIGGQISETEPRPRASGFKNSVIALDRFIIQTVHKFNAETPVAAAWFWIFPMSFLGSA